MTYLEALSEEEQYDARKATRARIWDTMSYWAARDTGKPGTVALLACGSAGNGRFQISLEESIVWIEEHGYEVVNISHAAREGDVSAVIVGKKRS